MIEIAPNLMSAINALSAACVAVAFIYCIAKAAKYDR